MVVNDPVEVQLLYFVLGVNKVFSEAASRLDSGRNAYFFEMASKGFDDACIVRQGDVAFMPHAVVVAVAAGGVAGSGWGTVCR